MEIKISISHPSIQYLRGLRVAHITAPRPTKVWRPKASDNLFFMKFRITKTTTYFPPFPFLHGFMVMEGVGILMVGIIIEDIESVKGPSAHVPLRNVCIAVEAHDLVGKGRYSCNSIGDGELDRPLPHKPRLTPRSRV